MFKGLMSSMKSGWGLAGQIYGRTGRAGMLGAYAGGIYGAFSGDTSILGGAAIGAGIGAGMRYGAAGLRGARKAAGILSNRGIMDVGALYRGMGVGAYRGMRGTFLHDTRGVRALGNSLFSNAIGKSIPGIPKGKWS